MNPRATIDEMASILAHNGVRLSARPFHSAGTVAGGAVKLGGQSLVIVDSAAPLVEQIMALAEAICSLGIDFSLLSRDTRLLVAKAHARRRWRRKRLLGRAAANKSLWLRSRLGVQSPGIRACKGNERKSSHH